MVRANIKRKGQSLLFRGVAQNSMVFLPNSFCELFFQATPNKDVVERHHQDG